jgi:hypothetical protein
MKLDLKASTSVSVFVLCDAGAAHVGDPATVEAEARRGELIAYSYGGNGDTRFCVLVDEPIDTKRAGGETHTGILRLPSGRLIVAGLEHLGGATVHALPAGTYEVTACDLDEEEVQVAGAERVLGPLTGILVVSTLLASLFVIVAALAGGLSLRQVAYFAAGVVALWAAVIALWKLTGAAAASRAREQTQDAVPSVLVHLQRLPDTTDLADRHGIAFGAGFA